MTRYNSSRPDSRTLPRAHTDECQRFQKHGPVQPMEPELTLSYNLKLLAALCLLGGSVWGLVVAFS